MARSKKIITGMADQLPLAIKSGKYLCGYKQALASLVNNKSQGIIITRNYPRIKRKLLEYYAALANNTPVLQYEGTNNDLAKSINNFFRVGLISILDQGEAELFKKETVSK